ncbi:MAG: SDR family NAD(P)-dependent oxidoreductase [Gammaproteobacteria bacterium]|nr:SDR family NAD(P)-dependent oxidoreductase [Pseudomonadales bacterium]
MNTEQDLLDKVFVVTGANSGIGFESARDFAARGATVVILCRNEGRGRAAVEAVRSATGNDRVQLYLADFSSLASVARAGRNLRRDFPRIDVLCNNAGAANAQRQVTDEGFELTFAANHLGGFLLTQLLLPSLLNAAGQDHARIVFTSSLGHKSGPLDFDDLNMSKGYRGLKAYGRSKLMNLLTARELDRRYRDQGIVASSFHPGAVRTPIWSKGGVVGRLLGAVFYPFMISVEKGADTMIWLAASADEGARHAEGHYYFKRERASIAPFATDEAATRLWEVSMELVQVYLQEPAESP